MTIAVQRSTNAFTATEANSYDWEWLLAWATNVVAVLATPQGYTKTTGKTCVFGDSMTVSRAFGHWAGGQGTVGWSAPGATASDLATIAWAHLADWDVDDGFYLGGGIGLTAYSGTGWADDWTPVLDDSRVTSAQFGLWMLNNPSGSPGTPDLTIVQTRINQCFARGIMPILSSVPPRYAAEFPTYDQDYTIPYNVALKALARANALPFIDYYAEIVSRRPNGTWLGTIIDSGDGVHPGIAPGYSVGANPYKPGGDAATHTTGRQLENSGYDLRTWLLVQKMKQIKEEIELSTPHPLADRVLVIYNSNQADSLEVANYYAAARGIPSENLLGIAFSDTVSITRTTDYTAGLGVQAAIKNKIDALGNTNILYIVMSYLTPYLIVGPSATVSDIDYTFYAFDSWLADVYDLVGTATSVRQSNPALISSSSAANSYSSYSSFLTYRASGTRVYNVWRLDAPSKALAKGLVDKAVATERAGGLGVGGTAYCDMLASPIGQADSGTPSGDWDVYRGAEFATTAGLTVVTETTSAEFGNAPAPLTCPNASLYGGWYSLDNYYDVFTWNQGAIGWHLDSLGLANPRGGSNWGSNAVLHGITTTTGAVAEPFLQSIPRVDAAWRMLFAGSNVGDAIFRNTPHLHWNIHNVGDPLYTPYPTPVGGFS